MTPSKLLEAAILLVVLCFTPALVGALGKSSSEELHLMSESPGANKDNPE